MIDTTNSRGEALATPEVTTDELTTTVTKRAITDAPDSFTKKGAIDWLTAKGAKGIITAHAVATILGVGYRVVKDAERAGYIPAIDKCTYRLDDVAEWLLQNPRFMAQSHAKYAVTDETAKTARIIILKSWRALLKYWELDDLIAEVCYRIIQQKKTSECSESLIITRVLAKIWREMKARHINKTVSLDAINERYGEERI